MLKTKIKLFATLTLLTLIFSASAYSQTFNPSVEVSALDTMAGDESILRASGLASNSSVVFAVKDPSGSIFDIEGVSTDSGVAITELPGYYTEESGEYLLNIRYPSSNYLAHSKAFTVLASDPSPYESSVLFSETVVDQGDDIEVLVSLRDKYQNPVPNHLVRVLSTDGEIDEASLTDDEGLLSITVKSGNSDLYKVSVEDLTGDLVLVDEMKLLYLDDDFGLFDFDKVQFANAGNSSGPIDTFIFEDVPSEFVAGEQYSLTVTAVDVAEETVTDYEGTIGFTITSDNKDFAEYPLSYEFLLQDQGSHTFSLAFRFLSEGSFDLQVADLSDTTITATETFVVGTSDGVSSSDDTELAITSPSAGKLSSNTIVITGTAAAASNVKIFDNGLEIADIVIGVSGEFSHTTGVLADGTHSLYVATVNEVGTIVDTSETVEVTVDTSSADLTNVIIDPEGQLDPGSEFSIEVYTDDTLSSAQVILEGNLYDLSLSDAGYYEADIAVPIEFGDYSIDVILVDELGNQEKFESAADISVGQLAPEPEPSGPGQVTEIIATPGDERVILSWSEAEPGDSEIVRYRVYYGLSATQLTQAVDTFTAATDWYVPDLENGELYYFSILAVDAEGNTSDNFAHIAAATPSPDVVDVIDLEVENGTAGEEALDDMEKDVSDSGPEVTWLVLLSLLLGNYFHCRKKKNA